MITSKDLKQNYNKILQQIDFYQKKYYKINKDITLLAVSKTRSIEEIIELYKLKQIDFAESYLKEALNKINYINKLNDTQKINKPININWHYIGQIQSNKTKEIAQNFNWVHSVDRLKIAQKLSQHRSNNLNKLNILIQVNLESDPNKSGVSPNQILELANNINNIEKSRLNLRGFMCILKQESSQNFEIANSLFKQLYDIYTDLNTNHNFKLDTLSMGMSGDFESAIAAGSTMLRIGTDIFGPRYITN